MKYRITIVIVLTLLLSTIAMIYFVSKQEEDSMIPLDYIAVFKGENAEVVYTTYLYETKKKTYKYINTISNSNGYDSTAWQEKIVKKGTFKKKKDIFKKIKNNNANSYVKYMKDDKIYTIEEFKEIWK